MSICLGRKRLANVQEGYSMKFMLLVHHDEAVFDKLRETTKKDLLTESVQLTHQLHSNGQYLSASPLQPTSSATVVRLRDGKPVVTDGPFIETREQIAGYFLIEAADRQEAITIASRVPGARIGSVEVRPLREISRLPEK
jgi:hypothetical protein